MKHHQLTAHIVRVKAGWNMGVGKDRVRATGKNSGVGFSGPSLVRGRP